MSQIIPLLNYEEGYRETPYYDSLGFPMVGTGILLGPEGTPLSYYTFTLLRKFQTFGCRIS
ncbi:hypothetical protein SGGMMB4_01777 [Sodalis glossinidius str. 'morsitans']|uniref:Uncharacterized protein n=1 Tax=Sodalis glossinidius (strain morsitans) TaxID=343509 RepID=A0A193QHE7_SODGM|nr:hypothetical protein SGGMMB4_01777 [Sodalis glossinidius str. 'morsitans']